MPRPYSHKFLAELEHAEATLGTALARVCVRANLPAAYAAQMLNISRTAIHAWFRGGKTQVNRDERIGMFIDYLERDLERGILPVKNMREAREYTSSFLGKPVALANPPKAD
jgi:hypothetical protein